MHSWLQRRHRQLLHTISIWVPRAQTVTLHSLVAGRIANRRQSRSGFQGMQLLKWITSILLGPTDHKGAFSLTAIADFISTQGKGDPSWVQTRFFAKRQATRSPQLASS